MHERKAAMAQEAEAFIALPGEKKKSFYIQNQNNFVMMKLLVYYYLKPLIFFFSFFFCLRRLWNYGGTAGDDNMVTTWYPQENGTLTVYFAMSKTCRDY